MTIPARPKQSALINSLYTTPAGDRRDLLEDHVCTLVRQVLGFDPADPLDRQQGFFQLGMDSLTAVELRNRLQGSFGCSLPTTLTFKYPTIEALVNYLQQLITDTVSPLVDASSQQQRSEQPLVQSQAQTLSGDELASSISHELLQLEQLLNPENTITGGHSHNE